MFVCEPHSCLFYPHFPEGKHQTTHTKYTESTHSLWRPQYTVCKQLKKKRKSIFLVTLTYPSGWQLFQRRLMLLTKSQKSAKIPRKKIEGQAGN